MSNYDAIKEIAAQFMLRNKMTSMHLMKNDYDRYSGDALVLINDAINLMHEYPDDFSMYVVALNIVGSNVRQLADLSQKKNDEYCLDSFVALCKNAELLENSILFLGSHINNENCANLLITTHLQIMGILQTILNNMKVNIDDVWDNLEKCNEALFRICSSLYSVAVSYHPSLELCKNVKAIYDRVFGDECERYLVSSDPLRPKQIMELYCEVKELAIKCIDDIDAYLASENERIDDELEAIRQQKRELEEQLLSLRACPEECGALVGSIPTNKKNIINGHEYVDLGLPSGLKWATCNVGASSPEEYGDYFAWGETETKSEYTFDNVSTNGVMMSYAQGDSQYDVARKKWGGTWRIPTKEDVEELLKECTWEWVNDYKGINGINGCKLTGANGNHIFLPAAGYRYGASLSSAGNIGCYWSYTPARYAANAYNIYFDNCSLRMGNGNRFCGCTVRPVTE